MKEKYFVGSVRGVQDDWYAVEEFVGRIYMDKPAEVKAGDWVIFACGSKDDPFHVGLVTNGKDLDKYISFQRTPK